MSTVGLLLVLAVSSIARVEVTALECSFEASSTAGETLYVEGVISSPNYPGPLPNCTTSRWTLVTVDNHSIIVMLDEFDVISGADKLFIYGDDTHVLYRFTGQATNESFALSSGATLVFFGIGGDVGGSRRRFKIKFFSVPMSYLDMDSTRRLTNAEALAEADDRTSSPEDTAGIKLYFPCDDGLLTTSDTKLRYRLGSVAYVDCLEGLKTDARTVNGSIPVTCNYVTGEWAFDPFCYRIAPLDERWEDWRKTKLVIIVGVFIIGAILAASAFGIARLILLRKTANFSYRQFSSRRESETTRTTRAAGALASARSDLGPSRRALSPGIAVVSIDIAAISHPASNIVPPTRCAPPSGIDIDTASV